MPRRQMVLRTARSKSARPRVARAWFRDLEVKRGSRGWPRDFIGLDSRKGQEITAFPGSVHDRGGRVRPDYVKKKRGGRCAAGPARQREKRERGGGRALGCVVRDWAVGRGEKRKRGRGELGREGQGDSWAGWGLSLFFLFYFFVFFS